MTVNSGILDELLSSKDLMEYLKAHRNEVVIKSLVTTCALRYAFCKEIEDRQSMWSKITSDKWRYYYCARIKDRPEVGGEICTEPWLFYYIRDCKALSGKNAGDITIREFSRRMRGYGYWKNWNV